MADIQAFDFKIKSSIHDYSVEFVDDAIASLANELVEGDVIIIDNNILRLYAVRFENIRTDFKMIGIDATEPQKSYHGIVPVIQKLIESGFKKNHRIVAIGGGITQDVAAFISSVLYRGVKWFFLPTSLLAQGDSCIGSKTSINFDKYKNQIGGFYPPVKIFIDLHLLDTLSPLELRSGLGEMCHYFIVSGEEDFKRFKREYPLALTDKKTLAGLIRRSLEIKRSYVEIDEFDRKERLVFNYGHTFGHAIESLSNYAIPHGIAVSYGMDIANYVSVKLGYIKEGTRNEIRELLTQVWVGTSIAGLSVEQFKNALSKDKKNIGNQLGLILNKGYGQIIRELHPLDDTFTQWLTDYLTNEI